MNPSTWMIPRRDGGQFALDARALPGDDESSNPASDAASDEAADALDVDMTANDAADDLGASVDASLDDASAPPDVSQSADAVDTGNGGVPPTDPVPVFDSATDAHVRALVAQGASIGNRHDVVAKIGDSITESASFLQDCGFGWYDTAGNTELTNTIEYFRMQPIDDRNSLNRASLCAVAGWSADEALAGYPDCPLTQELDAIQPQWAIVMYGTNDLERVDVTTYTANMNQILDVLESRSIVAVLSTIPPRTDGEPYTSRVSTWNDAIRGLAQTRHLPLVDFWLALQPAPGYGISSDGVHPNLYFDPSTGNALSCDFGSAELEFGYNIRNYTALEMLSRLRSY